MSRCGRGVFLLRFAHASARAFSICKRLHQLAGGLVALMLITPVICHANFTTPGSLNVAPDGSASYSIPIQVPPGTGGMSPQLALSYNSNGGNGIAGMGWGLNGLSQIARCPQTIAQDGAVRGIQFDPADRYCIDGQRLISTGGSYGADGTEYRTEIANFAKIVSYGVAGYGPAWFKVWTRAGQIVEYGNTEDSRIEAQGKQSVFTWAANKVSDTRGNYLAISYLENNASGETLLNRIDYTGNATAGLIPFASVRFSYETRPDTNVAYLGGSAITSTQRLNSIKTYHGDVLIKDYRLTYEQSTATQRSAFTSLSLCDSNNQCLQPVVFNYSNFTSTKNLSASDICANNSSQYGACNGSDNHKYIRYADINGDGRDDLCYRSDGGIKCFISTENGWSQFDFISTGICAGDFAYYKICDDDENFDTINFVDINGDGLADLVYRADQGVQVWYSTGTDFTNQYSTDICANGSTKYGVCNDSDNRRSLRYPDINGDGRADICFRSDSGINCFLSTSSGWSESSYISTDICANNSNKYGGCNGSQNYDSINYADFNGDGMSDLVYKGDAGIQIWYSNGYGFTNHWASDICADNSDKYGGCNGDQNYRSLSYADFNGDGLADLAFKSDSGIQVWLSTGKELVFGWSSDICAKNSNKYGVCNDQDNFDTITYLDINKDGLGDLIYRADQGVQVWYSTGTSFTHAYSTDICANSSTKYGVCNDKDNFDTLGYADINGDGAIDFVYRGDQGVHAWITVTTAPDLLNSVRNSWENETRITYKPLTDPSLYIKDSGALAASYPVQDIQDALYVVASVSIADGIGGNITTNYTYGGAKADLSGRGFLGFRWNRASSPDNNTNITSFYHQTYPYIGLTAQTEKRTNDGTLLSVSGSSYASKALSAGNASSLFTFAAMSLEHQYELDGNPVSSTAVGYQYDDWGNATQVTAISNDGHAKTTTSTYANDSTNWLLGRVLRTSVTSTSPDAGPAASSLGISLNPEQLVVNATAPGAVSATAALTVTGGVPPYTYGWSRMSGSRINASGAQNATFTATIEAGETLTETFRATVIDAAGNIGSTDLPVTFSMLPPFVFNNTITSNTFNYNLKNAAIAAGWDQIAPLQATITVNTGVIVGASSTSGYAFDTGSGIPAGSVLTLINNGKILGAGGNGGNGGTSTIFNTSNNTAGSKGGTALLAQHAIFITNNGEIGGGGGGAAGQTPAAGADGGGGGQGSIGGKGGAKGYAGSSIWLAPSAGTDGTATRPGSPGGGKLGSAGASTNLSGGAGGACIKGNVFIRWLKPGICHGLLY